MRDAWTDCPVTDGVVLIGDAAGYSDPHIGQGFSVALRDVRVLSELLKASGDWPPLALRPYAEERAETLAQAELLQCDGNHASGRVRAAGSVDGAVVADYDHGQLNRRSS
jgi:2-polyprenyl-6-methoxyphenol hydroxylase-like FAD-dependent oxidoreductase